MPKHDPQDRHRFAARYGPWALVTGAAQGLGRAFAERLAARGLRLILVDRQGPRLEEAAHSLRQSGAPEVATLLCDLAAPDPVAALAPGLEDRPVGLLVSNAALGPIGPFLAQPLTRHEEVLATNCRAPLALLRALGPDWIRRGRGGAVLVSSLSALAGPPLAATYAATKAWTRSLAESLWSEWRPSGVDVLAVLPGPVDTPAFRQTRPRLGALPRGGLAQPAAVAEAALRALGRSPVLVPGALNRAAALLGRLLPRDRFVALMGSQMRALYPDPESRSHAPPLRPDASSLAPPRRPAPAPHGPHLDHGRDGSGAPRATS